MKTSWLIVDGYSLVHRDSDLVPHVPHRLEIARERLIQKLEEVATAMADRITVVFDGRQANTEQPPTSSILEILFSPKHLTADTVIERLVEQASHPEEILVVTSDRAERETVSATGAQTVSCGQFLEACEKKREHHGEKTRRSSKSDGFALGDLFPKG